MDYDGEAQAAMKAIDRELSRPLRKIAISPALEDQFLQRTDRQRRMTIAGWQLVAVLVGLACLPLDHIAEMLELGIAVRVGIVTPVYLVGIVVLLFGPHWARSTAIAVPLAVFASAVTFLGLAAVEPFGDRYLMAIGLLLVFTNIVVPTSFLQAVSATTLSILGMLGILLVVGAPEDLYSLVAFIAGISAVSLSVRFRVERESRNTFLVGLRDELKSAHLLALTKALAELAETDPLTGLRNRRSLSQALAKKWREACEQNDWIGILMIDIDRFKLYNDKVGHDEGDRCLKSIAGVLAAEAGRSGQYIARFGGEEFTAILSGLAPEPAMAVAESLRREVEQLALPHPAFDKAGVVTVSIGASVIRADRNGSVEDVLAAADKALYRAKASGRNRVESVATTRGTIQPLRRAG
jgi:diguanylate cyclase (GGDEF)-like protein